MNNLITFFSRVVILIPFFGPKLEKVLNTIYLDTDLKDLSRGSTVAFFFKILSLPIGLVTSLIISRWYGTDAMGLFSLFTTVVGLIVSIGMLGVASSLPRFLGESRANSSGEDSSIYKSDLVIIFISGLICSLLLYFSAGRLSHAIFDEPRLIFPFQISAIFIFPLMWSRLNESFLLASKKIFFAEIVSKFFAPMIMLFIVFSSYRLWPTYYIPIRGYLLSSLFALFVTLIIFKKEQLITLNATFFSFRKIFTISVPMLITGMAFFVVQYTDILMLGFLTDSSNVGIYKVAVQISTMVSLILPVIATFLGPQLSEKIWRKDTVSIQKLLNFSNFLTSTSAVVIFIVLFSFASFFLGFFGPDFLFGVGTLRILLVYQLINVLTGFGGLILNHGGYEKTYSRILLYCAFLNILLNYLFIPTWGIIGAALSTAISFNLANFIVVYYNKKLLGVTSHFNGFRL